jgi:hypothetical protein
LKHKPLVAFTEADLYPRVTALPLELGDNPLSEDLVQHPSAEINPSGRRFGQ